MRLIPIALLSVLSACGWPIRNALISEVHGHLEPLQGFEHVRAVDGYPSDAFQTSFDACVAEFAKQQPSENGRRAFDILVLSSGGVNGAFGAGILTEWTRRGDRPEFWCVTGVSVGALLAPLAFAGPRFDDRIEAAFARVQASDLHEDKGLLTSVLWDESLLDSTPLRAMVERSVDMELLEAVAKEHERGRRCYVGSTNLDVGEFVVWDLGAIAVQRTPKALALFRNVLLASTAIPVVYPPVRFSHPDRDELHVDGAVIRPLFLPRNVFDGRLSAERAGLSWEDVDSTMYVVHNGCLRPRSVEVQRETLSIAMRTVTMMSYTMVAEHVLHLYMLAQVWGAQFQFVTLPDGLDLSVDTFTPEDTERLYLLGRGLIERNTAWSDVPPGFVVNRGLEQLAPAPAESGRSRADDTVETRLRRIEDALLALRTELRAMRTGSGQ